MEKKYVEVIERVPAAVVQGEHVVGLVELAVLMEAVDGAGEAVSGARYAQDVEALATTVQDLAQVVQDLAAQVYQVARGLRSGYISVEAAE